MLPLMLDILHKPLVGSIVILLKTQETNKETQRTMFGGIPFEHFAQGGGMPGGMPGGMGGRGGGAPRPGGRGRGARGWPHGSVRRPRARPRVRAALRAA